MAKHKVTFIHIFNNIGSYIMPAIQLINFLANKVFIEAGSCPHCGNPFNKERKLTAKIKAAHAIYLIIIFFAAMSAVPSVLYAATPPTTKQATLTGTIEHVILVKNFPMFLI